MADPVDCFLPDPIPADGFAIYDVDPEVEAFAAVGGRIVQLDRRDDGRVIAPIMKMDDSELDDMAWSLLLRCVNARARDEAEATSLFLQAGLPLWGHVTRSGIVLAVTNPRYFARRPHKDGLQGLMVYNPRGVVLIEPPEASKPTA